MYAFEYQRAASVADAAAMLAANPEAKLLAGGQTYIPTLKARLAQPSHLVDIARIKELSGIDVKGGVVSIGAMTRHAEVAESAAVKKAIPALAALAIEIGDLQVRNRGTLGGSVANNDPAADYPAAVLALGATVVTNKREIAADDFFRACLPPPWATARSSCASIFLCQNARRIPNSIIRRQAMRWRVRSWLTQRAACAWR